MVLMGMISVLVAMSGLDPKIASAQIVLDGRLDSYYGSALSIQNTQTGFGDSNLGMIDWANGSEVDALYARADGGFLYVFVAGNLQGNFNNLEIFVDGVAGGQNRLRGNNPDVDFNGLNRMGDDGSGNGLTFDQCFSPDLWVTISCGGQPFTAYMSQAQLLTLGGGTGSYLGSGGAGDAGAAVFKSGFGFGLDNSCVAGVTGGTGQASGSGVETGVEMRVPLASIPGYASGEIKVLVGINGADHGYLSNQVLGPLGGGRNLADPRFVNFNLIPGPQYAVVPGTAAESDLADDDGDGVPNRCDPCLHDPFKTLPGQCGCGVPDDDSDSDGVMSCHDNCPAIANSNQSDCDGDGIGDACEIAAGASDANGNGIPDACECFADLFVDGRVNGADLAFLLARWGTNGVSPADINRDGVVGGADLAILLSLWGNCP